LSVMEPFGIFVDHVQLLVESYLHDEINRLVNKSCNKGISIEIPFNLNYRKNFLYNF